MPSGRTRSANTNPPKLPKLLERKLYKACQTRGADNDVIFQNRVLRNSTVLFPYGSWAACQKPTNGDETYENGYIVLISPTEYFSSPEFPQELAAQGLVLGKNALVLYETREQWRLHSPEGLGWRAATSRQDPLRGQYVARVPATTARGGDKINRGFTTRKNRGAGIRVYEYANKKAIADTRLQLESLFWMCRDAEPVATAQGMSAEDAKLRKAAILDEAAKSGLFDAKRLTDARAINDKRTTTCPLCLEEFSAEGFFNRMSQAEGRLVPDLTVTELNLFHLEELRVGLLNHRPYNIGWGHHHCNVVARDAGIQKTLEWMDAVLKRQSAQSKSIATE